MIKKNENFLSIGELSKLTGVHIKSLRYYGEIGILLPAYIDPQNGYRYYTVSQIHLVEIIQLCVELDIPLKYFTKFMDVNSGKIDYENLLDYGTRIANEKIRSINKRLKNIQNIWNEVDHSKQFNKEGDSFTRTMSTKYCCVVKYEGAQTSYGNAMNDKRYFETLRRILLYMHKNELKIGLESGLLHRYNLSIHEKFLFVDVDATEEQIRDRTDIICIPAGEYLCKTVTESSIDNASAQFPKQFQTDNEKILIETELLPNNYNDGPIFELRCLIKKYT